MTAVPQSFPTRQQRARFETAEELLDALGVPASRIWLNPPPGDATESDVVRIVDGADKRLVELIDGTLVEKPVGKRESELAAILISLLVPFVYSRKLGKVYGADLMARMARKNIRLPDVAYVAYADMPGGKVADEAVLSGPITLAVEMLSPSNTKKEMFDKRNEYFASGSKRVWQFDLDTRTVAVYSQPDDPSILHVHDLLDGEDILPGFSVPLAELFDQVA